MMTGEPAKGPARILIVDDEQSVCEAITLILRGKHHTMKVFTDPREAASYVEANDFDIAFVDLRMPHISGAKIVELIRTKHPCVPVVIVAARSLSPVDVVADRVLLKPFTAEELRKAVSDLAFRGAPPPSGTSGSRQNQPISTTAG